MKVLITGITGFSGSHLAEYILNNIEDVEVYGSIRWRSNRANLSTIESRIKLFQKIDVVRGEIRPGLS